MIPGDLKFTQTHEWARLEPDGATVVVGITDYAVEQLGDIVYVELPPAGKDVQREMPLGVIESVKAAVEVYAPVAGTVVESNPPVTGDFELLSSDPYGKGWMVRIKVSGPQVLEGLMSPAEYEAYLRSPQVKH